MRKWVVLPVMTMALTLAACDEDAPPARPEPPSATVGASSGTSVDWPAEGEDSRKISFPTAADAIEFLAANMPIGVALPDVVPPGIDLDSSTTVSLATVDGRRTAQVHVAPRPARVWGITYGRALLDGCAPEHSRAVTVSGRPARLRVTQDPSGSRRTWIELIWPATLKRPVGTYGLYGWLSPHDALAMAESMAPVDRAAQGSATPTC